MNAKKDDYVYDIQDTTDDNDKDENLLEKPVNQEEINAQKFKPAYAYFVLFITLVARIMV